MKLVKRVYHLIEHTPLSLQQVFVSLSLVIFIRNFLEKFLGATHQLGVASSFYLELADYLHVYLYFLCVFLLLAWAIAVAGKLPIVKAIKVSVYLSPVIWVAPVLDYFIYGGSVSLYHFKLGDVGVYYVNMLNPFAKHLNISQGARVEMAMILVAGFVFLVDYLKVRWWRALLGVLLMYTIIFVSGFIPAVTKFFLFHNDDAEFKLLLESTQHFALQFVYMFIVVAAVLFSKLWIDDKRIAVHLASLLFPSRLFFYVYLLLFGYVFSYYTNADVRQSFHFLPLSKCLSAIVSIVCLFVYAKVINDEEDIAIDEISNPNRPIAQGIFNAQHLQFIKGISLLFSFVFIVLSSAEFSVLYLWFAVAGCSYLYSVPPFRLRRWFPVGHIVLACIGILLFLMGASLFNPKNLYHLAFTNGLVFYIAALFFVLSQFKDFKDVKGDSSNGVSTLFSYVKPGKNVAIILLLVYSILLGLFLWVIKMPSPFLWATAGWIGGMVIILKAKSLKQFDRLFSFNCFVLLLVGSVWIFDHF